MHTEVTVTCSGQQMATGHPLVNLNFGDQDTVVCPYCSQEFTKPSAAVHF